MPRGGGFRGGGFRGGGFRGGFRGGGFRGGPASFHTGRSGVPFGRTGSSRVVSRPPRGPYRHGYYYPHRRYYWWGYRPWYWRWWYSPWWSGYWYRPWYYSPVYVGGGILFAIILGLIILPFFGVGLWFPFTNTDESGSVNYRSTETLYYNEYWYEYEYVETGSIVFSVRSTPSLISFAIWDQPFENLPTINKPGGDIYAYNLSNNEYITYWLYLNPTSSINYDFTANDTVDFFIADAYQLQIWNQGGSPSFYEEILNTTGTSGLFSIPQANDYYLVWYNDLPRTVNVFYTINYIAANVINFSGAYEVREAFNLPYSGSFDVPYPGNWYFFVYFDPFNSPEESTTITFDVTYETGVTYTDRWIDISWILIVGLVIIVIVIIIAFAARKSQKAQSLKAKKEEKPEKPEDTTDKKEAKEVVEAETEYCPRCGFNMRKDANYCPRCGAKAEGRNIGTSEIITPAKAKVCSFCGSKLSEKDKFCIWCGTPIEK